MNLAGPPRVHSRSRGQWFSRVRRHAVSKLCACAFIALILIPFTAPFPTFHLDQSSNHHPYDALPKDFKTKGESDTKLAVIACWSLPSPLMGRVIIGVHPLRPLIAAAPPQHPVLRI